MSRANEKTSTKQIELLVRLMQEKPDIARNYTKRSTEDVTVFWDEATQKLNQLDGRQRDATGWKKVWSDHKTYVKKKLTANKKEITGTGGGPHKLKSFTPLEEDVIALININDCVNGIGATSFGTGNQEAASEPSSPNATAEDIGAENHEAGNASINRQRKTLSSIQLLRRQVENQTSYYNHMKNSIQDTTKALQDATKALQDTTNILQDTAMTLKDSAVHLKRVYRSVENLCEIEKKKCDVENKKLKEMQNQNAEMKEIGLRKLEMKAKILELEISKTNLILQ